MRAFLPACAAILALAAGAVRAQDMTIYGDALGAGWENWSWGPGTTDLARAAPVHAGTASASATSGGSEALFFHHAGRLRRTDWVAVDFWIDGGTAGGQALGVGVIDGGTALATVPLAGYLPGGTLSAGTWTHVTIPL